jgi:hypothetical protein
MAVTKQTYTATATWTAANLAGIFRSAFIDAGLMTEWHDSFLSGSVENRVLRVQYDAAKTYGTTFYWFMFTTSGVFLHVATGWNTSTDQPTGTQYLDYFSATTSSTHNFQLLSASTTNTVELVRYTSGVDSNQSWFTVKTGGATPARRAFTIVRAESILQPWLDLSKGMFAGFYHLNCFTSATYSRKFGAIVTLQGPSLRRSLTTGSALNGSTSVTDYGSTSAQIAVMGYGAVGNQSSDFNNNATIGFHISAARNFDEPRVGCILLPVNFSGTNPGFASNSNPVYHSMPLTAYTVNPLPSDFGLTFHYATNSFSQGDTFVVNSGVEEWEVVDFAASASSVTGASPLFLARVI